MAMMKKKPMMGAAQAPVEEDEEELPAAPAQGAPAEAPVEGEEETPMPEGEDAAPEDGVPATPEEQQAYEQFVANAMNLIYSEKNDYAMMKKIVERLRLGVDNEKTKDPIEALASVASNVFMRVVDSATKKGVQINPDVMMQAGFDIVSDLADLSKRTKVYTYSTEEVEGAYYQAADMVRAQMQQAGMLDAEKSADELEMLRQAEEQGMLEDVLPGATQAAEKLGAKAASMSQPEEGEDEAAEDAEDTDAPPAEAAPPPNDDEDDEDAKPKGMSPKKRG